MKSHAAAPVQKRFYRIGEAFPAIGESTAPFSVGELAEPRGYSDQSDAEADALLDADEARDLSPHGTDEHKSGGERAVVTAIRKGVHAYVTARVERDAEAQIRLDEAFKQADRTIDRLSTELGYGYGDGWDNGGIGHDDERGIYERNEPEPDSNLTLGLSQGVFQ